MSLLAIEDNKKFSAKQVEKPKVSYSEIKLIVSGSFDYEFETNLEFISLDRIQINNIISITVPLE
jgi:hypothetical protein